MKLDKRERNKYIRAARQLLYSPKTIEALKKAETVEEAERIMVTARHNMRD